MKPGDHPDFFRFPAPAGRSRESSIRLDGEGRFWHDGRLVEHGNMSAAFARWIDIHPDDGRYVLTNGYDWTYFSVDDVPFFVRSVRVEPAQLMLQLNDGSEEALEPRSLKLGARDALYLRVKGGKFAARFTPQAQLQLAPCLEEGPDGSVCLVVGEDRYAIGSQDST